MIDKKDQSELRSSVKDVTDAMGIVTDSMLILDDKTGDLVGSTKDLTAAYDINSDSSVSVAQEQEKLAGQIKKQRKEAKKSTSIEKDYHSERRKRLEETLNNQQPLYDYTHNQNSPDSQEPVVPEDTRETLKEFIKREVGEKDDFIEEFKKENGKTGKFIRDIAKKANVVDRMKNSETSATAKILGHTMSAGIGMFTGTINDLLSSIPGYDKVAKTSKFVGSAIYDAHSARKEKKLNDKAEAAYESKKNDAVSRFQQIPVEGKGPSSNDQVKEERNKRDDKKEKDENRRERDANDKRHRGLIGVLKSIQTSMLIGRVLGLLAPLAALGGSMIASIGGLAASISGIGVAVAAALSGVVTKLLGNMSSMFSKIPGFGGSNKTPTAPKPDAPKTTSTRPNTTTPDAGKKAPTIDPDLPDGKGKNGKPIEPKPDGKAPKIDKKGMGKGIADTASKMIRSAGPGAARVGMMALKLGARAIPFAGAALLAYDIYSAVKDNPEMVEKGMNAVKGVIGNVGEFFMGGKAEASEMDQSKLEPVMKTGEDKAMSQRIEENNKKVEAFRAKQAAEEKEREERRQGALYASYNTKTYSSMNSVLPSGFGPYQADQPIGSYGVQPST